ncbi:MAG: ABC transporter permease subunit [Eubacteriales bacterium]
MTNLTHVLKEKLFLLVIWLSGGLILSFILLPILQILFSQSASELINVAALPDVKNAILLSLKSAVLTALLAALLGVPLAYSLARKNFPGKGLVEAIVDLPLAVPHTVAGIALLFVFGRNGIVGRTASHFGISFWGTEMGIIVGMLFVSIPFMVNTARQSFESVDFRLEKVARTLGATPAKVFWQISFPLAFRGILTGIGLTYARSIAEFGAVIVLAYYPETAPVKIYELFLEGGLRQSSAAAALLLLVTVSTFIFFRYFIKNRSYQSEVKR